MKRILEPEVMDTPMDAEEYDAMDFEAPNTRFAEDALAYLKQLSSPEILDVGAGTARIPILMAKKRPDVRILGIDLAREMIRVGVRNVAAADVADQVRLTVMDAKLLRIPGGYYDMVVSNSTIHHLADPIFVLREMARVTKPGGAIVIRDLARPETMDEAWAIVKRAAAGDSRKQQQLFFDSLCAGLTVHEITQSLVDAGLGTLKVSMVSERHWSAEGVKPLGSGFDSKPPRKPSMRP